MKYYCIVETNNIKDFGEDKSHQIQSRYQKSLLRKIKYYEHGFECLGYKFLLIESNNNAEILDKIKSYSHNDIYRFVSISPSESNYENTKNIAFEFVRESKTFIPSEENTFSCGSCNVYFDKLNGAVEIINKGNGILMKNIIMDYVLALSYLKKIQHFQEQASNIDNSVVCRYISRIYWNFIEDFEIFETKEYFSNPLMLSSYQSYDMWNFLYKNFNLKRYHDDMLRQRTNILKDNETQKIALFACLFAMLSAIFSFFTLLR